MGPRLFGIQATPAADPHAGTIVLLGNHQAVVFSQPTLTWLELNGNVSVKVNAG